jgi:tetratricopeptide (TPR) repeat protein
MKEYLVRRLIDLYEEAIGMGNHEASLLDELGAMYHRLHRYTDAIDIFERVLGPDSSFAPAWIQLAYCHHENSQTKEAITIMERSLQYVDDKGLAYRMLARLYYSAGSYKESFHHAVLADRHGVVIDSTLWQRLKCQGLSHEP